jgi:hypothetical protein
VPRCNRVAPSGEIFATAARGLLMGNRGCLHDASGEPTRRRWTTKAWISCRLDFKNRRRPIAPPGRWTALFFLDEATALAAGHRPCGECRRDAFTAFKTALGMRDAPIAEIDARLHEDRLARPRPERNVADLPDGAMVELDGGAHLVRGDALLRWTPLGYARGPRRGAMRRAPLLTASLIVDALRRGYAPVLHPSADDA